MQKKDSASRYGNRISVLSRVRLLCRSLCRSLNRSLGWSLCRSLGWSLCRSLSSCCRALCRSSFALLARGCGLLVSLLVTGSAATNHCYCCEQNNQRKNLFHSTENLETEHMFSGKNRYCLPKNQDFGPNYVQTGAFPCHFAPVACTRSAGVMVSRITNAFGNSFLMCSRSTIASSCDRQFPAATL